MALLQISPASVAGRLGPRTMDRLYWASTGLLCLIFAFSGVWTLVDLEGARVQTAELGFPTYFEIPQSLAKLAAVYVILARRWRTLTAFAYAGLLYDMILALGAHLHERQWYSLVAVFGIVVWVVAFIAWKLRYPPTALREEHAKAA